MKSGATKDLEVQGATLVLEGIGDLEGILVVEERVTEIQGIPSGASTLSERSFLPRVTYLSS